MKPIKRVIKHKQTNQYYAGEGKWVPNVEQAMDFKSLSLIIDETIKNQMRGSCVLVLKFDLDEFDVELSI